MRRRPGRGGRELTATAIAGATAAARTTAVAAGPGSAGGAARPHRLVGVILLVLELLLAELDRGLVDDGLLLRFVTRPGRCLSVDVAGGIVRPLRPADR